MMKNCNKIQIRTHHVWIDPGYKLGPLDALKPTPGDQGRATERCMLDVIGYFYTSLNDGLEIYLSFGLSSSVVSGSEFCLSKMRPRIP
jgi:hypothetical protein